jgi:superfamily I DNA/RNA helicase
MDISEDKRQILSELEPGAALIIEGAAGTGKTLMGVLCGQKLLQYVIPWQKCLYLTFSKLAKRQITECIQKLVDNGALDPNLADRMDVLNYHSLWWRLITKQYSFLGISQEPLLCTSDETRKLAEEGLKDLPLEIVPSGFLTKKGYINQKKERYLVDALSGMAAVYAQWGPENFGRNATDFVGGPEFLGWSRERILGWNRQGQFSHAETVCWAYSLLKHHPNELALMREEYPIVIIDEFQDTDLAQWDIVQVLAPKTLIAMADAAQTIHIWRGADPERLQQLKIFCESSSKYCVQGIKKLTTRHRSPMDMSECNNITWKELKDSANPANAYQFNRVKFQAKATCKTVAREMAGNGKTVAILCLTNDMADEVTDFLRNRQTFDTGGYLPAIPCMRLGVENSPFESARVLVLRLLEAIPRISPEQIQGLMANSFLQDLLPCKIDACSATSRKDELKKRWASAERVAKLLTHQFGIGLRELTRFAFSQARSMNCFCDMGLIGCIRHIGDMISRIGIKAWKEMNPEEKRRKIDAAVLQYENALASSRLVIPVSVMTVHQSKGREFSVVIVPWFTPIPWSVDEPIWDTSTVVHENLFHTACTRAREEAIVIFPKGQMAAWPSSG